MAKEKSLLLSTTKGLMRGTRAELYGQLRERGRTPKQAAIELSKYAGKDRRGSLDDRYREAKGFNLSATDAARAAHCE
jgi:hypothetical protein